MEHIAQDLHLLPGRPRHGFNAYLMGDVLVDAGTRHARRRILRALAGHGPAAHALTHAHADHQGASAAVCDELRHRALVPATPTPTRWRPATCATGVPLNLVTRWQLRYWAGPAHPVARRLREGDEVGGFTVLETPGHSPGHVSFWREADRTLVAGDVLFGRHRVTGRPGLHEPPDDVHARSGAQPRRDPPPRGARAGRRLLRSRPAAARPGAR